MKVGSKLEFAVLQKAILKKYTLIAGLHIPRSEWIYNAQKIHLQKILYETYICRIRHLALPLGETKPTERVKKSGAHTDTLRKLFYKNLSEIALGGMLMYGDLRFAYLAGFIIMLNQQGAISAVFQAIAALDLFYAPTVRNMESMGIHIEDIVYRFSCFCFQNFPERDFIFMRLFRA